MPRKLTPEQAKAMLEKYRADDPVVQYKSGATFQRATECVARFICIKAVNQIGKTAWLQYTCASLLRGKHPTRKSTGPVHGLLVVPARAQAAEVWGKRLLKACELSGSVGKFPWIPKREIAKVDWAYSPVGKYPGKITLKNGSTLLTILSGDPNSWKRLEGMTFDFVIRDEVAGSENLGDEIQPRLVRSFTKALNGETLWGGIMVWAATETKYNEEWSAFKDRAESGVKDHAVFAPSPDEAAAYVSMEAREAMKVSMSADSYRIRGEGGLDAGDLVLIYQKQWDEKRHVLAAPHEISPEDNLWVSWDPGVEHPTGILIAAISKDRPRQLKLVQGYLHSREAIAYDVECLDQFLLGRKIAGFVYDYAAKNRSKTGAPSVRDVMIDKLAEKGYDPIMGFVAADKRHKEGIDCVREYLDPNPYDRSVDPLIVLNPPTPQNQMGQVRAELISYRGKEGTQFTGIGGVVKKNDEFCDTLRYLARCLPAYSPALRCGYPNKQANPVSSAEPIPIPPSIKTRDQQQAALSALVGRRTRSTAHNDYNPFLWMSRLR
jgi:hypothetical protein